MKIAIFQFRMFGINTYIVYDPDTLECAIIDPGMSSPSEEHVIDNFILKNNLKLKFIINTHLHIDHVVGNKFIQDKYNIPVLAHADEEILGKAIKSQASMFGLSKQYNNVEITQPLSIGETIKIGNGELKVISVAGHSPGGIALYDKKDGFVIVGDALFQNSIGRTDLYGGDLDKLLKNIRENLFSLPDETIVFAGHGPSTTIGEEKLYNPYLR